MILFYNFYSLPHTLTMNPRPINRRATSIPNRWFSSCSATQKKRAFRLLFFGCFTWIGNSHWLKKPTGPFHLSRSADKSPCDLDSEPMVLIVLRDAKKKEPFGSYFLAASHGFEPRLTESESAVLPLDDEAINCGIYTLFSMNSQAPF